MTKYIYELKTIQSHYADLITSFDFSQTGDSFYYKAIELIEKCEQFWTRNCQNLTVILNNLTSCNRCFILEGAVFLDVKNKGQYKFATLGDYHFLNDPFVKMRNFFALGKNSITDYCREYFLEAYNDTVYILKNYSEYFYFISLEVLCAHQFDEDIKIGDKVYWDIISDAFGKEYKSLKDLGNDYHTLDEIERDMRPEITKHFIFSERNDINLSLKERVEKYCKDSQSIIALHNQTDIQKFYFSTVAFIQQAVSISLNCLQFNLHPFIRYEVSFHYLILLLNSFASEKIIEDCLLDVIISYLISSWVIGDKVDSLSFSDFFSICKREKLTDKIYNKIKGNDFNISTLNIRKTINDILEVYHSIFKN